MRRKVRDEQQIRRKGCTRPGWEKHAKVFEEGKEKEERGKVR